MLHLMRIGILWENDIDRLRNAIGRADPSVDQSEQGARSHFSSVSGRSSCALGKERDDRDVRPVWILELRRPGHGTSNHRHSGARETGSRRSDGMEVFRCGLHGLLPHRFHRRFATLSIGISHASRTIPNIKEIF